MSGEFKIKGLEAPFGGNVDPESLLISFQQQDVLSTAEVHHLLSQVCASFLPQKNMYVTPCMPFCNDLDATLLAITLERSCRPLNEEFDLNPNALVYPAERFRRHTYIVPCT